MWYGMATTRSIIKGPRVLTKLSIHVHLQMQLVTGCTVMRCYVCCWSKGDLHMKDDDGFQGYAQFNSMIYVDFT